MDLVEDNSGRKFALKRIQCHSTEDEKIAFKEVEYMRGLNHPNLIALVNAEHHPIHSSKRSLISEINIVMPFYRVSSWWCLLRSLCGGFSKNMACMTGIHFTRLQKKCAKSNIFSFVVARHCAQRIGNTGSPRRPYRRKSSASALKGNL